jgi:hypothetical protein
MEDPSTPRLTLTITPNPKHHFSTNIGAGSALSRYQHLLTKPV